MYKLVVSSFYNTLVNDEEAISSSFVIEMDRIRRDGVKFAIMTNNNYLDIINYDASFHFIDYIISYNGALVFDVNKDKIIMKKNILLSNVKKICKLLKDKRVVLYTLSGVYYVDEKLDEFLKDNKVYKIDIYYDEDNGENILEVLNNSNLKINYYEIDRHIEIISSDTSKLQGLLKICGKTITLDEVIGVGYDTSDLCVLDNIGNGVVVSNSGLKKYKKTSSNLDDGVEKFVKKFL